VFSVALKKGNLVVGVERLGDSPILPPSEGIYIDFMDFPLIKNGDATTQ
jgi:hypothetical protein